MKGVSLESRSKQDVKSEGDFDRLVLEGFHHRVSFHGGFLAKSGTNRGLTSTAPCKIRFLMFPGARCGGSRGGAGWVWRDGGAGREVRGEEGM